MSLTSIIGLKQLYYTDFEIYNVFPCVKNGLTVQSFT